MKAFIILILIITFNQLIFADPGDTMLVDDEPDLEELLAQDPTNVNFPKPENILVVYSNNVDSSEIVAQYYASIRNIPEVNIKGITIPAIKIYSGDTVIVVQNNEIIRGNGNLGWRYVKDVIADTIEYYLNNTNVNGQPLSERIRYIVMCKGLPQTVFSDPYIWDATNRRQASVSALLSLINQPDTSKNFLDLYGTYRTSQYYSPMYFVDNDLTTLNYCFKPNHFVNSGDWYTQYLVSWLNGDTFTDVKGMIDRSENPDYSREYTWVLDDDPDITYDDFPAAYQKLISLGFTAIYDNTDNWIVTNNGPVIGYASHGIHSSPPMSPTYILDTLMFDYSNGASFSTLESFNCVSFGESRWDQGLLSDFIHMGGTGGSGHVQEPRVSGATKVSASFPSYAMGYSIVDAQYHGILNIAWQNLVVGDPLTSLRAITVSNEADSAWQLVSVPVGLNDYNKNVVFPTAAANIYKYVPGTGYVNTTTLANGPGYWTKFNYNQTLTHSGLIIDTLSIGISTGWNIIGSLSYNVVASEICTNPSGIISAIYAYDNGYVPLTNDGDLIKPGVGYWVYANNNGNVILSGTCGMQKITSYPQIDLASLDKFIITDSNGKQQSLYVGNLEVEPNLENFDWSMPPPVPELGFDARFNYGEIIKVVSIDSGIVDLEINVESNAYPITLAWELNPENGIEYSFIGDSGLGKISKINIIDGQTKFNKNAQGSIQLFGKVSDSFTLNQVPNKFELYQNYPNPFNPVTTIKYDIIKSKDVKLAVYDILGREVATLVNEQQQPGSYEVKFDASNVSSGIYFYQLKAGDFIDTKKMILIK
ncbi:MAG: TIGR03790 family protein [Ignavibacteriaceae bacterium]|nr:TIGR03790 family protein [Ignavibacteriaceae bacterium]